MILEVNVSDAQLALSMQSGPSWRRGRNAADPIRCDFHLWDSLEVTVCFVKSCWCMVCPIATAGGQLSPLQGAPRVFAPSGRGDCGNVLH